MRNLMLKALDENNYEAVMDSVYFGSSFNNSNSMSERLIKKIIIVVNRGIHYTFQAKPFANSYIQMKLYKIRIRATIFLEQ